jgi:hypothetical protein
LAAEYEYDDQAIVIIVVATTGRDYATSCVTFVVVVIVATAGR